MELGNRFPSDDLVVQIAETLRLDPGRCLLEVYHDRSPALGSIFAELGLVGEGQNGGVGLPTGPLPDRGPPPDGPNEPVDSSAGNPSSDGAVPGDASEPRRLSQGA